MPDQRSGSKEGIIVKIPSRNLKMRPRKRWIQSRDILESSIMTWTVVPWEMKRLTEGKLSQRKVPPSSTRIMDFNEVNNDCVMSETVPSAKSSCPQKEKHSRGRLSNPSQREPWWSGRSHEAILKNVRCPQPWDTLLSPLHFLSGFKNALVPSVSCSNQINATVQIQMPVQNMAAGKVDKADFSLFWQNSLVHPFRSGKQSAY